MAAGLWWRALAGRRHAATAASPQRARMDACMPGPAWRLMFNGAPCPPFTSHSASITRTHGGESVLAASIGIVSYLGGSGAAAGATPVCGVGSRTATDALAACSAAARRQ
jgi:hypothetical protein